MQPLSTLTAAQNGTFSMHNSWWVGLTKALRSQLHPRPVRRRRWRSCLMSAQQVCVLERRDLLAGFTPGNLVVSTIGTGATLSAAATVVTLREYGLDDLAAPTSATLVNTVAAPSTNAGNNSGNLTDAGNAASHGALNLAADGSQITLIGYDAPPGTASVGTSTATANYRSLGSADAAGTFTVGPRLTDAFPSNSARSAVTVDGSAFWVSGNPGVRYVGTNTATATTSTPLVTASPPNARFATIATDRNGNRFLIGNSTASVFVWTTANLPTNTTAPTALSLSTLGSDLGEVIMLDRSPALGATGLGGLDTIYVTNGQASTSGSIAKFEWNGSAWVARSSRTYTNGLNGLTARVTDTGHVQLFATTRLNTGNNQLLTRTDTSAYGSDMSLGSYTVLASSGAGYGFRGLSFTPDEATPSAFTTGTTAVVQTGGLPVSLLGDVVFGDGSTFNGGSVTVSGGATGDVLSIADVPAAVTISGNAVLFDGTQIGVVSGGVDAAPLRIDFNARNDVNRVTREMVEQLLEQLQFATDSTSPSREFTVTVGQATDHRGAVDSFVATQTIEIAPQTTVNQPPTELELHNPVVSIAENRDLSAALKVADLQVVDDGEGTHVFALSGANEDAFEIVGSALYLKAGTVLNAAVQNAYTVTVTVDDPAVGTNPDASVDYTLSITPRKTTPTISLSQSVTQISEATLNSARRKVANVVVSAEGLGTETLQLNGADAGVFELLGTELFLLGGTVFDFETQPSYVVHVDVGDPEVEVYPGSRATLTLQIQDVYEPPKIQVTVADTPIADGGAVYFGSVAATTVVTRTFSVTNIGFGPLTLQPLTITGTEFSLSSANFTAGQTLAVNATLTFTIAMHTASAGTRAGAVILPNSDLSTAMFNFDLSGAVLSVATGTFLIDDGDPGFSLSGGWGHVGDHGYGGDAKVTGSSSDLRLATWAFGGLAAGQYRIETTWLPGTDRTATVPYSFREGVGGSLVGQTIVNQRLYPSGATAAGNRPFSVLGTVTISGDTLVVEASNAGTGGATIIDAVRIVPVTPPLSAPRLNVLNGIAALGPGASHDFGSVSQGAVVTKSFTVNNTGTADLILQPITLTGTAFTLLSANFVPGMSLAPSTSTTITVGFNTAHLGGFTGKLSFGCSDALQGQFEVALSGTVNPVVPTTILIDDGDAGFALAGAWGQVAGYGYAGDAKAAVGSNGASVATWTFNGLTAGEYKIDMTWLPGTDRANNIPFIVRDGVGGPVLSTFIVSQQQHPTGAVSAGGRPFAPLGWATITGSVLVIEMSNAATNGAIIADAIRIERATTAPDTPRVDVTEGAITLLNGSSVNYGSAIQGGTVLTKTFTVRNPGTAALALQPIVITGTGFSLVSANFTAGQLLAPNAAIEITVQLSTTTVGTFNGMLSFGHNAGGPFDVLISGSINPPPPIEYWVDDGDTGFAMSTGWGHVAGHGYGNDSQVAVPGGSVKSATWTFSDLAPGTYRIDATWLPGSDRTSRAPYAFFDGTEGPSLGNVLVDQRPAPSGAAAGGGRPFGTIATVTITSSTLVIQLTSSGINGALLADAMRITKVG